MRYWLALARCYLALVWGYEMLDDVGGDYKSPVDDADGDYRGTFSVMMIVGLVLGVAALLFLDDAVFAVWFCGWFGGLLLGAGAGLWTMDG